MENADPNVDGGATITRDALRRKMARLGRRPPSPPPVYEAESPLSVKADIGCPTPEIMCLDESADHTGETSTLAGGSMTDDQTTTIAGPRETLPDHTSPIVVNYVPKAHEITEIDAKNTVTGQPGLVSTRALLLAKLQMFGKKSESEGMVQEVEDQCDAVDEEEERRRVEEERRSRVEEEKRRRVEEERRRVEEERRSRVEEERRRVEEERRSRVEEEERRRVEEEERRRVEEEERRRVEEEERRSRVEEEETRQVEEQGSRVTRQKLLEKLRGGVRTRVDVGERKKVEKRGEERMEEKRVEERREVMVKQRMRKPKRLPFPIRISLNEEQKPHYPTTLHYRVKLSIRDKLLNKLDGNRGFSINLPDDDDEVWSDTEEEMRTVVKVPVDSVYHCVMRREVSGGSGPWAGTRSTIGWPLVNRTVSRIPRVPLIRQPTHTVHHSDSPVLLIRFIHSFMISVSHDGCIRSWKMGEWSQRWSISVGTVSCAEMAPTSNTIVVGCGSRVIWVSLTDGSVVKDLDLGRDVRCVSSLEDMVAVGCDGCIYQVSKGVQSKMSIGDELYSVCQLPNGRVAYGVNGRVVVLDGGIAKTLRVTHSGALVNHIVFKNGWLIAGSHDGIIKQWDSELTEVAEYTHHDCEEGVSDFYTDGLRLYTPDCTGLFAVYTLGYHSRRLHRLGLSNVVQCLSVCSVEDWIATGHVNGGVAIWNL